jgi:hypothetical protein
MASVDVISALHSSQHEPNDAKATTIQHTAVGRTEVDVTEVWAAPLQDA